MFALETIWVADLVEKYGSLIIFETVLRLLIFKIISFLCCFFRDFLLTVIYQEQIIYIRLDDFKLLFQLNNSHLLAYTYIVLSNK